MLYELKISLCRKQAVHLPVMPSSPGRV